MKPLIKETQDKQFIEVIGHYDNPILCAKLTAIADLFAVEKKEGYAKFRIEDKSKLAVIDDGLKFRGYIFYVMGEEYTCELVGISWADELDSYSSYFEDFSIDNGYVYYKNHQLLKTNGAAVLSTDYLNDYDEYYINLTGTKWVLNENINFINEADYDLDFTSNSTNYLGISIRFRDLGDGEDVWMLNYFNDDSVDLAVAGIYWENQTYRIIEITGGIDVTNTDLIEWLLENATQVPVGDLTGTTWLFNDNLPSVSLSTKTINFYSYNEYFSQIRVRDDYLQYIPEEGLLTTACDTASDTWYREEYKTISITNGTDTTNPDLITWLSQNATLQEEPQPSANNIFFGSLPVSKILYGNKEVEEIYWGSTKIYSKNN